MAQWLERSPSPMWLGFDYRRWRHMWDDFVVSFRPCSAGLSPYSDFSPSTKPTFLNSNLTWKQWTKSH